MSQRKPTSVLLPTVEWGPACEQLHAGLDDEDELPVLCDSPADPVVDRETPAGVDVIVAGEPVGCSGKANALACGMEAAVNDRFVRTDDDFDRDPEWLDRLRRSSQRHGPTTLLPDFVGGGWWRLAKPALLLLLAVRTFGPECRDTGEAFPWGGCVAFHRDDLETRVDALVSDLRRSLSDDLVLDAHLRGCRRDPDLDATVRVDGSASAVYHRLVRYMRADHVHDGLGPELLLWSVVAAIAVLFPLPAAAVATATVGAALASVDQLRPDAADAYPAVLVLPAIIAAGMVVREFEWAGRRYRVRAADDVEVVERSA
jgi:hypothetical protein